MSTGLVHFKGSHCVANFVTTRAGVLEGWGVVLGLHMVPHILSASVGKLVANVAGPLALIPLLLHTAAKEILRRCHLRNNTNHSCRYPWVWPNKQYTALSSIFTFLVCKLSSVLSWYMDWHGISSLEPFLAYVTGITSAWWKMFGLKVSLRFCEIWREFSTYIASVATRFLGEHVSSCCVWVQAVAEPPYKGTSWCITARWKRKLSLLQQFFVCLTPPQKDSLGKSYEMTLVSD